MAPVQTPGTLAVLVTAVVLGVLCGSLLIHCRSSLASPTPSLLLTSAPRDTAAAAAGPQLLLAVREREPRLSDARGFVAVQYSGTARSFSAVFLSHLMQLICASPFTVHLYFVVMVLDGNTEHWSVPAALGRYRQCRKLDGDWLTVKDAVKGWRLQRQAELNEEEEVGDFVRQVRAADGGWQENTLKLYWAQHAVDELRRAYEQRTGVRYHWVLRQRLDTQLGTDFWHSLYTVTPLWEYLFPGGHYSEPQSSAAVAQLHQRLRLLELRPQPFNDSARFLSPDGRPTGAKRSHLVGDLVWTPHASSLHVHTPSCSTFGGVNDQVAVGGSEVMRAYFQRAFPPFVNQTVAAIGEAKVQRIGWYQTETYLQWAMRSHSISVSPLRDFCFQLFYSRPRHAEAASECSLAPHGRDCCGQACGAVNERREATSRILRSLSGPQRDNIANHSRALLDLARALATHSGGSVAPHWRTALAAIEGAPAELARIAAAASRSRSSPLPPPAARDSVDSTTANTTSWLRSAQTYGEEGDTAGDVLFPLYSAFTKLARSVVAAARGGDARDTEELDLSADVGQQTWWKVASSVGLLSGRCDDGGSGESPVNPWQLAEQRMPNILRLATDADVESSYRLHEACTAHRTLKYP